MSVLENILLDQQIRIIDSHHHFYVQLTMKRKLLKVKAIFLKLWLMILEEYPKLIQRRNEA